jgi:hypothetical protein
MHNAIRRQLYLRGRALEELPISKVLWDDDEPVGSEPQLSWGKRDIILQAFAKGRESLFRHLEQTLGVERRLLVQLERAFDEQKERK